MTGDLAASYEVTRRSGSSFRYSFFFLPKEKRDAITAVYAFCRAVDDVVDEERPAGEKIRLLNEWRGEIARCYGNELPRGPLARALVPAIEKFGLPRRHFEAIIDGCEMDVSKSRYADFTELETYCYRVASAVGLLCIEIFGYEDPQIRDYAVSLGMALQLTNILRDVGTDYGNARIYLPRNELEKFGVSEEDIAAGKITPAIKRLLRYQAERARSYYEKAAGLLPRSDARSMLAARIMGDVYRELLTEIEKRDFDVFTTEVKVPKWRRLLIALGTWWRALIR